MLIRLQWKERGYWLECTKEEAQLQVFPRLDQCAMDESHKVANQYEDQLLESFGLDTRLRYCFLISNDLKSIEPFSPMYPYHPMWNAYSPFEMCEKLEISSIDEIKQE